MCGDLVGLPDGLFLWQLQRCPPINPFKQPDITQMPELLRGEYRVGKDGRFLEWSGWQ